MVPLSARISVAVLSCSSAAASSCCSVSEVAPAMYAPATSSFLPPLCMTLQYIKWERRCVKGSRAPLMKVSSRPLAWGMSAFTKSAAGLCTNLQGAFKKGDERENQVYQYCCASADVAALGLCAGLGWRPV